MSAQNKFMIHTCYLLATEKFNHGSLSIATYVSSSVLLHRRNFVLIRLVPAFRAQPRERAEVHAYMAPHYLLLFIQDFCGFLGSLFLAMTPFFLHRQNDPTLIPSVLSPQKLGFAVGTALI